MTSIIIMIRSILTLQKIALISRLPAYRFCSKADILKTYLEIIPPHKIYQIREKKEHRLQNAIKHLEQAQQVDGKWQVDEEALKTVVKEVKKRTNMIPVPVLTRIAELSCQHQDSQYSIELKKTYAKIIRTVKYASQKLPLEEMIDLVYKLVKKGKKQYELMKQVEKIIIEDRIKIDYPLIRKILYSYTHLNQGSAVLYSHISKTLIIGQHQFRPSQLAQAAYMLSKVSQNAKGGYGIFKIAEEHVQAALPRMSFAQLVKISSYLLTQDLGSNKFQLKLEQYLYNTYPSKDRIKITDFVALLKSTSGYYFKFKEGALLSMLKTTTLRMTKFATLQQFEDIVWSWGRIGKGDKETWECLQKQLIRHLHSLKPRQLAFAYYSLCSTAHATPGVLQQLENKFVEFPLNELNEHYLIKFLLGMHRKKFYENTKFSMIGEVISSKIQKLSNNELISFLKILNESDIDYETKDSINGVIEAIKKVAKKLESKLYVLKLTQIAELLFLIVKFQINDDSLSEKCFFNLDNVIDIPKSVFIKSVFALTIKQKYHKVAECIPILEQLTRYGPIGYFFSPYEFPLLAYCIFNLEVNGQNIRIDEKILSQTEDALKQINPNMLNQFVLKGYSQAMNLIDKYHGE